MFLRKMICWGLGKEKKLTEKNIELSAEFNRYLFEHPEVQDKIPIDSEIILLPDYDQELKKSNLRMGKDIEAGGGKVFHLSIKVIRPNTISRIKKLSSSLLYDRSDNVHTLTG